MVAEKAGQCDYEIANSYQKDVWEVLRFQKRLIPKKGEEKRPIEQAR